MGDPDGAAVSALAWLLPWVLQPFRGKNAGTRDVALFSLPSSKQNENNFQKQPRLRQDLARHTQGARGLHTGTPALWRAGARCRQAGLWRHLLSSGQERAPSPQCPPIARPSGGASRDPGPSLQVHTGTCAEPPRAPQPHGLLGAHTGTPAGAHGHAHPHSPPVARPSGGARTLRCSFLMTCLSSSFQ